MIDIRDHGGNFNGKKSGPDFVAKNFTPPPQVAQAGSYERVQVGKTVAFIRTSNQVCATFDLLTGTRVATTSPAASTPDLPYMVMDENDDLCHRYHYISGINNYRPRAYDKNFFKVWESVETVGFAGNSVLTKDFLFLAFNGNVYKISRATGATLSITPHATAVSNEQQVFGTNEDQTQIIYMKRNAAVIFNVTGMSLVKAFSFNEVFSDSNTYPYGVAIKDGVLHIFTYNSQNYIVQYWAYPVSATVFDATTRLFQQQASANSWENGNAYQG